MLLFNKNCIEWLSIGTYYKLNMTINIRIVNLRIIVLPSRHKPKNFLPYFCVKIIQFYSVQSIKTTLKYSIMHTVTVVKLLCLFFESNIKKDTLVFTNFSTTHASHRQMLNTYGRPSWGQSFDGHCVRFSQTQLLEAVLIFAALPYPAATSCLWNVEGCGSVIIVSWKVYRSMCCCEFSDHGLSSLYRPHSSCR